MHAFAPDDLSAALVRLSDPSSPAALCHLSAAVTADGWLEEKETESIWPGQRFSLKLKAGTRMLHEERSEFQHLQVLDSSHYGRVLVLDGVIQLTERDEFAYQEMIVHLPMFAHANPRNVLIVGGGDGGVLREVLRHPGVERVVMCEIDRKVCEVSRKFFADTMAVEFDDPSSDVEAKRTKDKRARLLYMDAAVFMAQNVNEFDVIIVDSSDPVGPAETLYTSDFYANMKRALRPGGIVCTQGECQFLSEELIHKVMGDARDLYAVVDYAYSTVPTYPCGQIGYIMAKKEGGAGSGSLRVAQRPVPAEMALRLRYYTAAMHRAAFVLPAFMARKLGALRPAQDEKSLTVGGAAASGGSSVVATAAALVVGAACGWLLAKRR